METENGHFRLKMSREDYEKAVKKDRADHGKRKPPSFEWVEKTIKESNKFIEEYSLNSPGKITKSKTLGNLRLKARKKHKSEKP